MTPFVENVTHILSFFVVVAGIFAVAYFILLITPLKRTEFGKALTTFVSDRALPLGFLATLAAVAGSLFYSEVAGFEPCLLCWWQRVFLYPQAILLLTAIIVKDRLMRLHSITLSIIGGLIALYHTYIQFGGTSIVPCDTTGASCTIFFFLEYGYVTIPTMSLTIFAIILLIMFSPRHPNRG